MRYPLFGIGQAGKSVDVTAQRRLNLYLDIQPQEDKTQISLHQRPGYDPFVSFGEAPVRGAVAYGGLLYFVHASALWEVTAAGTKTNRGTLNTASGRVGMAANRGGEIFIADGTNGYVYTVATTSLAVVSDVDYPDSSNTITHHDGFFFAVEENTSNFHISTIDDGSDWPGDSANAEKSADYLLRVIDNSTEVILMGEQTMEFWSNTGAADFPYERITGAVIEQGLAALWSVARYGESSIICLARNGGQGRAQVIRIDGFKHVIISNPEIDTVFNRYTVASASGFSYTHQGHQFYQINFPADGKSWLYDGSTNLWSEVGYGALGARDRAEIGIALGNETYVTDYENGNVYKHNGDAYADSGEPVVVEFDTRHIFDEKYVQLSRLWLDIEGGVGNADAPDPQVLLRVSKDGGHSWGNEKMASIGKVGEYAKRALFRRLGRGYDWVFRVRIADPVKKTIVGAWANSAT